MTREKAASFSGDSYAGSLAEVDAVILAGGLGTRLRAVVGDSPKALALIHGRPFLEYLLDQLIDASICRVVLCVGFGSRQMREFVAANYRGLQIVYSEESVPLGTAGALRLALPMLQSDPVLVMNGDSYCGAKLADFWLFHRERQASASLLLARVADGGRFGRVGLSDLGEVTDFEEKGKTTGAGLINAGVYLINRALIEEISAGHPVSLEHEIFPSWLGRRFYGFPTAGRFLDIGTPDAYASAEEFFSGWQQTNARAPRNRKP